MGVQQWVAYGPERILEKIDIAEAYSWVSGPVELYRLEWLPSFNFRRSSGQIVGNRSASKVEGSYVFWDTAPELWSRYDIVEYLLRRFVEEPDGPTWDISGAAAVLARLQAIYEPIILQEQGVANIERLLRNAIPTEWGFDWRVVPTETGFALEMVSLLTEAVTFADPELGDITFPAAPVLDPFDATITQRTRVRIEESRQQMYDAVMAVGERVRTCFTPDVQMTDGWPAALETAYKAATMEERENDKFLPVYQRFVVPLNWDWNSQAALPLLDDDGLMTGYAAVYNNNVRDTLSELPLLVGWDYTADPAVQVVTEGAVDYLKPQAYAYNDNTERLEAVDLLSAAAPDERGPSCDLYTLENELGVLLKADKNHRLARDRWGIGPDDDDFDPDVSGIDTTTLQVTLSAETDERLVLIQTLPEGQRSGDGLIKMISVPGAHFDWLAPDTILGVTADGADFVRAPAAGMIVRNDREQLARVVAGGVGRYLRERNRATIMQDECMIAWVDWLGSALPITDALSGFATFKGIITSVMWNFIELTTTLRCGQANQ